MIKLNGLGKFDSDVKKWFRAVEVAAGEAAAGMAAQSFNQVLYTSPQFTGDFVANWRLNIGSPDTTFVPYAVAPSASTYAGRLGFEPFGMGDTQAIRYAKVQMAGKLQGFKLGQSIFLSNSAKHDEAYAPLIEAGLINLRPVNSGAAHVLERALRFVRGRNSNIKSAAHLAALRRIGV